MATVTLSTAVRRIATTLAVILIVLYLAGGTGGVRRAVSRARAWMFPTQQEIQRSVVRDTAPAPAAAEPPVLPVRLQRTRFAEPPSMVVVGLIVGSIFVGAVGAMYLTGRDGAR